MQSTPYELVSSEITTKLTNRRNTKVIFSKQTIMWCAWLALVSLGALFPAAPIQAQDADTMHRRVTAATRFNDNLTASACHDEVIKFDSFKHKQVYTVGVHANRGFEAANEELKAIFEVRLLQMHESITRVKLVTNCQSS